MILFIIRHAESWNNRLARQNPYDSYMSKRVAEPPLTELGHHQAKILAEHIWANPLSEPTQAESGHLDIQTPQDVQPDSFAGFTADLIDEHSGFGITKIYCSAMPRSMQTAWPISQALELIPEIWIDIHEHGGLYEGNPNSDTPVKTVNGMTRSEIAEQFPDYIIPDEITEDGWWWGGVEDHKGCFERASRVAETLVSWAKEGNKERIALVSHGTYMDALIKALLNHHEDNHYYYSHYNTAVTRVEFSPDGFGIVRYVNRTSHLPPQLISK